MTDHNDARAKAVEAAVATVADRAGLAMLGPADRLMIGLAIDTFDRTMAEAGWVRVPMTATDEIAIAGRDALASELTTPGATLMAIAYDTMISAAMLGRAGEEG